MNGVAGVFSIKYYESVSDCSRAMRPNWEFLYSCFCFGVCGHHLTSGLLGMQSLSIGTDTRILGTGVGWYLQCTASGQAWLSKRRQCMRQCARWGWGYNNPYFYYYWCGTNIPKVISRFGYRTSILVDNSILDWPKKQVIISENRYLFFLRVVLLFLFLFLSLRALPISQKPQYLYFPLRLRFYTVNKRK